MITKSMILAPFALLIACSSSQKAESPAKVETDAPAENKTTPEKKAAPQLDYLQQAKCHIEGDDRTITVKKDSSSQGCEVHYMKHGQSNNVASSVNGTKYCMNVSERIQTKLIDAGFKCEPKK